MTPSAPAPRFKRFVLLCLLGSALLSALACGGGGGGGSAPAPPPALPTIVSLAPNQGFPGTVVVITGTGLAKATQVTFGTTAISGIIPDSDTQVTFTVPIPFAGAAPAAAGPTPITVTTGAGTSAAFSFSLQAIPAPPDPGSSSFPPPPPNPVTLASFAPGSALPGGEVTLTGTGLTAVTAVSFNGVSTRNFRLINDTTLRVTVSAASLSGPITLQLPPPQGPVTSLAAFTVLVPAAPLPGQPGPTILLLAPAAGRAGDEVVITGSAFTGTAAVAFNGVEAQSFTVDSDTRITAFVGSLARTGPVTVSTPRGVAPSPQVFTILSGQGPIITGFDPPMGQPGTRVTITGAQFTTLRRVSFGGVPASSPRLDRDTQITAVVPTGALPGVIEVDTGNGSTSSQAWFQVVQPPPTISKLNPPQGPVGTPVIITGTGFLSNAQVFFNGVAAPNVIVSHPAELDVLVPAGATTGPVTVQNTPTSVGTSPGPFTVAAGAPALDVFVAGWYITQATQDLQRSVPLVANRDGYLRVFVRANQANAAIPGVRVTIAGTTGAPWQRTISAPGASTPMTLQEGILGSSWNLPIPGVVLQPGSTLQLELDPDLAVPAADRSGNALRNAMDIRTVSPLKVTLVPITQANGAAPDIHLNGRTTADWISLFSRIYPFATTPGGIEVREGTPLRSAETLRDDDDTPWATMAIELQAKQVADGAEDRIYYGVVRIPAGFRTLGLTAYANLAENPNRFPLGTDAMADYQVTFAHEMGHALGRDHAPCGGVTPGAGNWPGDNVDGGKYRNAMIGIFGFDVAQGVLKDPQTCTDIMAYCANKWVSDFTYRGIMDWRQNNAGGPYAAFRTTQPALRCLQVSGMIKPGSAQLEPALILKARPALPEPGAYTLELLDGRGRALVRVPFALGTASNGAFSFNLPMDAKTEKAMRTLKVRHGASTLASRTSHNGRKVRAPHCAALRPGVAYLGWDQAAYPKVMVQDPRTGVLLGFGKDGALELPTDAPVLEVTFSDGVRNLRRLLPVHGLSWIRTG